MSLMQSLRHWLASGLSLEPARVAPDGGGQPPLPAAPALPVVRSRRATIDGVELFWREAGPADGPAIVLLHGFPSSSHMFRKLIPLLADRFRVIAPDYPGFGHSSAPADYDWTFDNLAATVDRLLDRLEVRRAVFYMQDYGGPVGMRLAVTDPARVAGFVIQNANFRMEGVSQAAADVFMPLWQQNDDRNARQLLTAEMTKFQYTAGARDPDGLDPDAWTHDQATTLDREGATERQLALFRDYASNVARYDAWADWMREHQPPTLVTWGSGDPFFLVPGAEAMVRELNDAELHLFDSGHFALEEDAAGIAGLIRRRFLA
ncbi:alpha/beta fold hydrolase [Derxia gummosa]|uniref:Alpha/beta fold hydrolase n=1 Tax=Derxia gummosa DSM 723 TaxID=1121388 RepID=A0A9U5C4H5_9BURK|nr:alpha/beta hydrolase [Derxia gummosa]